VERSFLSADVIMELLGTCLKMTLFEVSDEFYQQTDRMAMGTPLSSVISNTYMENFEKVAIEQSDLRHKIWLRYIDDIRHMATWQI
jgi:hypothetical protein